MELTQDERETLKGIVSQKKVMQVLEKYFIRSFDELPLEYQNVPNESLGEIIKAQLTARALNKRYLTEMKLAGSEKAETGGPVAPD